MERVLLHGTLHVTVYEVDRIHRPRCGNFFCKMLENIEGDIGCGKACLNSKLYVTIGLDLATVGQTRMLGQTRTNPQWQESLRIYCAHIASKVIFSIREDNPIGAVVIGRAYMPTRELLLGGVNRWLQIRDKNNKPTHRGSKIHVNVQFFDATQRLNWSNGIGSPTFPGVPYTLYPQRSGCRVTLYQDAHVPDQCLPQIPLAEGKYYEPHRCWEDIYDVISNAKYLIYIAGWSIYTKITLIRDPIREKPETDIILGELLKKKAKEGVRVLMLVWEDRTSVKLLKNDGVMATHDEDTEDYFKNTDVHCILCTRNPDYGQSIIQDIAISTMFTHHQKTVVADSGCPNAEAVNRGIVSFIGGIDLCDGRYDTPVHSLFGTLDTAHQNDFRQPNFSGASIERGGPREPWHDIHCRLEGPIAWDVLSNFEHRWRKEGKKDMLLRLGELDDIIIPASSVMYPEDHETWNVQLFRSIDSGDAFGFPDDPEEAARAGLVSYKDAIIERSIQDAYINAIRRAKSFIYIENQYFLGSSFCWKANDIEIEEVGALHLIPKELSLKIVSKIKAGERFAVYVVIPMWPEGVPESESVQAILNWQNKTMEMMYSDIAEAFLGNALEANPKDYLSFFCLGNRELKRAGEYEPSDTPEDSSDYSRAQQARRFMIYVHSKLMIVDDEYLIIGSANINQRSMDGGRDTEIAMGAFQPYHLTTKQPARGQVHGFRMSLWNEHLGMLNDSFLQPETLECIRKVNGITNKHWDLYTSETLDHDLPGHLLPYPVGVTAMGEVINLPGTVFFPDTRAQVLGSRSELLPPILTT